MKKENRREFITKSAITGAGIFTGLYSLGGVIPVKNISKNEIHIFTKCLQFLSYEEMSEVVADIGFDGADLTVRPGGQVLPENVESDLPKVVNTLRSNGIGSSMITTAITNPEDLHTERILKTMAELGIRNYRMGYLSYDEQKSVAENLEDFKPVFEKLEKLNRKYNVHGDYQNHSGTSVGAPVWDLYALLKNRDPEYIGVQYDIRHATVEGGKSWPLGMKLLAAWINTTDIKDFIWEKTENNWDIKNLSLGEGMVDFNKYFEMYLALNNNAPVSIHYEYDLGGAEHGSLNPAMSMKTIKYYLKKDLTFLQNKIG